MLWLNAKFYIDPPSMNRHRSASRLLHLEKEGSIQENGTEVRLLSLSGTKLIFNMSGDVAVGEELAMELPQSRQVDMQVVWRNGVLFGCRASQPIELSETDAELLK